MASDHNRVSTLRSLDASVKPPTPQQRFTQSSTRAMPRNHYDDNKDEMYAIVPIPHHAKPCTITGIVTIAEKSRKTNGKWERAGFVVQTNNSKKRFWIHPFTGTGYCTIHAEDLIELSGVFIQGSSDTPCNADYEVWLDSVPMIEPSVSESAILTLIVNTFPRRGAMCLGDARRVYNKLASITGDMDEYQKMDPADRVNMYMTRLSTLYNEVKSESDAPDKFYPALSKPQAIKLLKEWYTKRISRLLYMLGLSKDEIRDSTMEPTVLYETLKSNPYTVPFISIQRAQELSIRYRLGITHEQVRKGEILREVYKNQVENLWMGMPLAELKKKFRDFEVYREELTRGPTCYVPGTLGNEDDVDAVVEKMDKMALNMDKPQFEIVPASEIIPFTYVQSALPPTGGEVESLTTTPVVTDKEGNTKYGWDLRIATSEDGRRTLVCMRQAYEDELYVRDYLINVMKHWNAKPRPPIEPVYKMQTLSDDQKTAITGVLNHPIGMMMGNPGCGKTSCLLEILRNVLMRKAEVMIASFTGVAISRVTEVLEDAGMPTSVIRRAATFHRLIHRGIEGVDENDVTHLIVDENSFTSTTIFAQLLKKYQNIRWMLFVGDNKQLQTLSHGQFFNELITSGSVPAYILTKCHRVFDVEGETDGVLSNVNTMSVIGKDVPFIFDETKNFQVCDGGEEQEVVDLMSSFRDADISPRDMCVLTPYNIVRDHLSILHKQVFYANNPRINDSAGKEFRLHQVVMCTENNYDVEGNLYNGECGVILHVDEQGKYIRVSFDRDVMTCSDETLRNGRFRRTFNFRTVFTVDDGQYGSKQTRFRKDKNFQGNGNKYSGKYKGSHGNLYGDDDDEEDEMTTKVLTDGSVKSAHRSQGTEKNHVIVFVPPGKKASRRFLCKNILLVMISRAKRSCFVVGEKHVLEKVAVTQPAIRHDMLGCYLKESLGKTTEGMDTRCVIVGTYDDEEMEAKRYFDGGWDDDFD